MPIVLFPPATPLTCHSIVLASPLMLADKASVPFRYTVLLEGLTATWASETLSNTAVLSVPRRWLDTARPICTDVAIGSETSPTSVHVLPSGDE